MKLFYSKTSKDPTYYVQKGFRVGKKTTTKNIHRIGKHSELLKITDDPLAYAKQIVAQFNEETQASALSMDVKIDFSEKVLSSKDTASSSTMKNIGYFALQAIYHNLRIREFFKDSLHNNKVTFAPNDIIRFLIFSRILNPTSKLGTYKNLHRYYEDPIFSTSIYYGRWICWLTTMTSTLNISLRLATIWCSGIHRSAISTARTIIVKPSLLMKIMSMT